jgi:hypothetical protein
MPPPSLVGGSRRIHWAAPGWDRPVFDSSRSPFGAIPPGALAGWGRLDLRPHPRPISFCRGQGRAIHGPDPGEKFTERRRKPLTRSKRADSLTAQAAHLFLYRCTRRQGLCDCPRLERCYVPRADVPGVVVPFGRFGYVKGGAAKVESMRARSAAAMCSFARGWADGEWRGTLTLRDAKSKARSN